MDNKPRNPKIVKMVQNDVKIKNESNYFVTCKYFRLILQFLQTVTNVVVTTSLDCYK